MDYTENQGERLFAIANRPRATRTYRGSKELTETSIEKNHVIREAKLLLDQMRTAGGRHIMKNEIANFLCRAE